MNTVSVALIGQLAVTRVWCQLWPRGTISDSDYGNIPTAIALGSLVLILGASDSYTLEVIVYVSALNRVGWMSQSWLNVVSK